MKILIIEDDKFITARYVDVLTEAGHHVDTAENGEVGLGYLQNHKPDLVLLDILMPKVDGYSVLEEMHEDENLSKIPVLVLTNLEEQYDKAKMALYGAVGYIVKADTDLEDIVKKVEEFQ